MKFLRSCAVAICSIFFFSHAIADVIYENGAFNGTDQAAQISPSQALSNSFTVVDQSRITLATLGLWSPLGSEPLSLTWSIGSNPFATDFGSGVVSLENDFQMQTGNFFVYLSTFTLDVLLAAGDYWLTLSNGSSNNDPFLGWDINNGPSAAYYRNNVDEGAAPSEYFKLEGELVPIDPIPEPSSIAILAVGLAALAGAIRRHPRARAGCSVMVVG